MMASTHTNFWLNLLAEEQEINQRIRLWNGYLGWKLPSCIKEKCENQSGWPQLVVDPPDGGWPNLTEMEFEVLNSIAEKCGGHPKLDHNYMDFSGHSFIEKVDLSGLTFIFANFNKTQFHDELRLSKKTRFYAQTWFHDVGFVGYFYCEGARFDAPVSFEGSNFMHFADFFGTKFIGGASFANVTFDKQVMFNDSIFEERYFSGGITVPQLANFRNAKFTGGASFRGVLFGNDETAYTRRLWPERRVDFSDAVFETTTTFRGAAFGGPPAFFNASLHEDTDFSEIDWNKADTENVRADYAIRAWERLELMMSKLEKPFDRHQFFRLKMRAKRQKDSLLLRAVSWLFDKTADYGWGLGNACAWWLSHWILFAALLFINACSATTSVEYREIALASIGTSFSNAHAFLFLTTTGGYLEEYLRLLEDNDGWGLVKIVGVSEAILGPIFLFLVLLTLRNRFRLV